MGIAPGFGESRQSPHWRFPLALSIHWPSEAHRVGGTQASFRQGWREALKTKPGRRLLLAGFVHSAFEGILISTTSLFLAGRLGTSSFFPGFGARIGTIAGLLLAIRWTADMLFGPLIGALSDRIGQVRTLILLALILLISLLIVVGSSGIPLIVSLSIMFIASAGLLITLAALANGVALKAERPHIYVGIYATAVDGGAALGPLLAYFATRIISLGGQYVLAAVSLILAILWYRVAYRVAAK